MLKKLLGIKDRFNLEAGWETAGELADRSLALIVFFKRHENRIAFPHPLRDRGFEFTIKDPTSYFALVEVVKTWRRQLRASEYIHGFGEHPVAFWTWRDGTTNFHFEYAVDNDSRKPYIVDATIRPIVEWQNTSRFTIHAVEAWVPPGKLGTSKPRIGFDASFKSTSFDPTKWHEEPFGWENFSSFPYG